MQVESNITSMCQRCQLTEEQRFELVNSVRLIFGLSGTSSKSFSNPPTADIVCVQASVVDPNSMNSSDVQEYVGSSGKEASVGIVDPSSVNEDATWAVVDSNPQLQPEVIWRDGNGPTVTVASTIDKNEVDVKPSDAKQQDTVTSKENLPANSLAPPTTTTSRSKPVEEKSPGILSYFTFSLSSSKPKATSKPSSMLKILSSTSSSTTSSPSSLAPALSTVSEVSPPIEPSPPPVSSTISATDESINVQFVSSTTTSTNNVKGEEDLFAVL